TAQAGLEHERTGVRHLVAQRVHAGPHLPAPFRGHELIIGLVEREQVLRHDDHSHVSSAAGLWSAVTSATKWPPPKRHSASYEPSVGESSPCPVSSFPARPTGSVAPQQASSWTRAMTLSCTLELTSGRPR